jgi:hypothetical protein
MLLLDEVQGLLPPLDLLLDQLLSAGSASVGRAHLVGFGCTLHLHNWPSFYSFWFGTCQYHSLAILSPCSQLEMSPPTRNLGEHICGVGLFSQVGLGRPLWTGVANKVSSANLLALPSKFLVRVTTVVAG